MPVSRPAEMLRNQEIKFSWYLPHKAKPYTDTFVIVGDGNGEVDVVFGTSSESCRRKAVEREENLDLVERRIREGRWRVQEGSKGQQEEEGRRMIEEGKKHKEGKKLIKEARRKRESAREQNGRLVYAMIEKREVIRIPRNAGEVKNMELEMQD
jgi:hypothetical protein